MRRRLLVFGVLVGCALAAYWLTRHQTASIRASLVDAWTGARWMGFSGEPGRDVPHVRFAVLASDRFLEMAEEHVITGSARFGQSDAEFHLSGGDLAAYQDGTMSCVLTLNLVKELSAGLDTEALLALLDSGAAMHIKLALWDGPNYVYQAESQWMAAESFVETIRNGMR